MATKTAKTAVEEPDEPQAATRSGDEPHIELAVISTKETDFVGRSLVTPGTDSKDYLGRATTATADHLGRLLLDA